MAQLHDRSHKPDIDQLNSFLRGEISAVETYEQALEKLSGRADVASTLTQCRDSHERRVEMLRNEIQQLGGRPAQGSGLWGSFAKLVEGTSKPFGEKAAIAALEQGEDHGRDDYQRDLRDLSPAVREFVRNRLMPEQQRTHDTMSALKHRL